MDNEGRAVVGFEAGGEGGCRVVGETCSLKVVVKNCLLAVGILRFRAFLV